MIEEKKENDIIRNEKGQIVKAIAQNTNKNGTAGRPTVMTPETLHKLESVFAIGGTDMEACFFAGISPQTLYNYQADNPDFIERKEMLKEGPILKARQTVVDSLENPDYAFKYLERKKKDEFSTRVENEHRGDNLISQLDEQNKRTKEIIEEWQNANNSKQPSIKEPDNRPEAGPTGNNGDRQSDDSGPCESV